MDKNVVIPNPAKLEDLKKSISEDGVGKLHVLADFDRTLTCAFVNGEKVPSMISVLRSSGEYLGEDYAKKAHVLYNKYHPIEVDPKVPLKEKKRIMREWWRAHFDLIIKSGLNKRALEKVVESRKIKLRNGFSKFIDFLRSHNIPLVIMSSSGIGIELIEMFLKKKNVLHDNIFIISNSYEWDKNGKAIRFKKPIIHTLNKDETLVRDFPAFKAVKNRKNVLLLGDNLSDTGMVEGFDYNHLIKVGFLNEKVKENLEHYKQSYDVVILNDSPMDYLNKLLQEMFILAQARK